MAIIYGPRQRDPSSRVNPSRWFMLAYADDDCGGKFRVGYCSGWREFECPPDLDEETGEEMRREHDRARAFRNKFHDDGHATAQGASECFADYLLDLRLELDHADAEALQPCLECGAPTQTFAVIRIASFWDEYRLCPEHLSRPLVAKFRLVQQANGPQMGTVSTKEST